MRASSPQKSRASLVPPLPTSLSYRLTPPSSPPPPHPYLLETLPRSISQLLSFTSSPPPYHTSPLYTSLSLCPVLSVLLARSDPARSTIESLPTLTLPVTCAVASDCSMVTCSTACEREDTWFAAVGSTVRYRLPEARVTAVSR